MKLSMFRSIRFVALGMLVAGGLLFMPACETTGDAQLQPPEFSINSSKRTIMAGEVVTFTVRSANTVGRDPQIDWSTTGGELSTEQNDRLARVRFDRAGTYVVTAQLSLDGEPVETDAITVEVRPITSSDFR